MEKFIVGSGPVPDRSYPRRKKLRLEHYDYSKNGLYFITICIQNRLCLLGNISNNEITLNSAGEMIKNAYFKLEEDFQNLICLDYVVMPNHIHFIIQIEHNENAGNYSLFDVLQRFKSVTTGDYIKNVKQNGWLPFEQKLWQRSYYEHIIRDEKDYLKIAEYIENNPCNWQSDILFQA